MIQVFVVKVFDPTVKDISVTRIPDHDPPSRKKDETTLNELLMRVHLSKRISLVSRQLKDLKQRGKGLVKQIKREYNLKYFFRLLRSSSVPQFLNYNAEALPGEPNRSFITPVPMAMGYSGIFVRYLYRCRVKPP